MREIVSNTSPLLYLHQLGRLDLLPALYSKVLVPKSVVEELAAGKAAAHDVPNVAALPWVHVVSSPTLALLALATDLGKGESEAIAIAHERGALLILDDALGRRHASLIGAQLDRDPRSAPQGQGSRSRAADRAVGHEAHGTRLPAFSADPRRRAEAGERGLTVVAWNKASLSNDWH